MAKSSQDPVCFEAVWQTQAFLRAVESLTRRQPGVRAKLRKTLNCYLTDRSLLQRSPIIGARRDIYHTRVDGEKRLIDEPLTDEHPNEVAALYVDHHDRANDWGKKYNRDTRTALARSLRLVRESVPSTYKAAQEARPSATARKRSGQRLAAKTNKFGDFLTQRELLARGVPKELLSRVMRADDCTDLTTLGLTPEVSEKVENWYLSKLPSTITAFPVPSAEPAQAIRVTKEDLAGILRLPLHRFLATLTEEQRRLAERSSTNLFVVKGAAGSGKTVVGVRRIEHYVKQRGFLPEKPILFTCYNKVLANAASQMISDSLGKPHESENVIVKTAFKLMSDLQLKLEGARFANLASRTRLQSCIAKARENSGDLPILAKWSNEDLLDEILEVIFGRALTSITEYVEVDRRGRGRRLDAHARRAIWTLYRDFRRVCEGDGIAPWDQLPARLLGLLTKKPLKEPTYAAIVIDEAQDLPPSFFQLLLHLQAGDDHNLVVLGDAAQNVYRNGFRWNQTGLTIAGGQVTILRRCFRSTPTIVAATRPLISGQDERFEEDLVLPEAVGDEGPKVAISLAETQAEELEMIADAIANTIEKGVPPSSIGVLLDNTTRRNQLAALLKERDCLVEDFIKPRGQKSIDIFESSVKLLTTGSAKGLEFTVLFLASANEATFPGVDADGETADRARRSLYTAMMRCGYELHISAIRGQESSLLSSLDPVHTVWG